MASASSAAAERRLKLDESILTQQHDVASHARLNSLLQEVTPTPFELELTSSVLSCLCAHRLITSPRR